MKHIAKKRFGQNFLTDQAVITSLVDAISPQASDLMVEIGPGLGALTKPLLQRLTHLHVVEVDRDIIHWMQKEYAQQSITIHNADALKFDFSSLIEPIKTAPQSHRATEKTVSSQVNIPALKKIRVTGNLPYNISTPILFHLLDNLPHISDMHFMLQKEVVERMVAAPSSPAYGRLSVMLQYHLAMEYLITVPPEAFEPAPKVESAFVRCLPHATKPHITSDYALFYKIVLAAFGQRRKTIRNTLKDYLNDSQFATLNINSQLRAENLSVKDYVQISNFCSQL